MVLTHMHMPPLLWQTLMLFGHDVCADVDAENDGAARSWCAGTGAEDVDAVRS